MIFSFRPGFRGISMLVLGALLAQPAGSGVETADPRTPSTLKMARLLQTIDERLEGVNPFEPRRRISELQQQTPPSDLRELLGFQLQLAQLLLYDGQTEASIREFEELLALVESHLDRLDQRTITNIRNLLGVAWLRLGEQQNCIHHHVTESCLLPIQGAGVHRNQTGSRAAMREFQAVLQEQPDHLAALWLLNIAAMTVGEYPDSVPERWRIPPERFESTYDVGRFRDVAPQAGLDVLGLSGGSILEDFDGDGLLDVVCSSWSLKDQLRYFHNNGDGTFSERTDQAGLKGITGGLNLLHADYDNDGWNDVLVLRGGWKGKLGRIPNSLLRNLGNGTFSDVTEAAGLLDFQPSQTAAWADFNGDGHLDLFVGNESYLEDRHPCRLFQNRGDGTFSDAAERAGLAVTGFVKGVAWGDFNQDGRPDLYISRLLEPNLLFRNDGPGETDGTWIFTDVSSRAGVTEPLHSFPTWFWDFDNDGWLDIFVAGYELDYLNVTVDDIAAEYLGCPTSAEKPRLYRNNRDGTFADVTVQAGLDRILYAMGSNFGDLDNDGFLDFYAGTGAPDYRVLIPNLMFRNSGGQFFQDVTVSGGFGHLQKGHGVSFGDIDNDGDQDIYEVMGGAYAGDVYQNVLFENPGHGNGWITLLLEGTTSNRSAIGARIRVEVKRNGGSESIFSTVGTGGSFGSSSLRQEIGLGTAESIEWVEVEWPSGARQRFEGLSPNRFFQLREGDDQARPLELPRIRLSR